MIGSYRDLDVWLVAMDIVDEGSAPPEIDAGRRVRFEASDQEGERTTPRQVSLPVIA
jgi:hypothetical protein